MKKKFISAILTLILLTFSAGSSKSFFTSVDMTNGKTNEVLNIELFAKPTNENQNAVNMDLRGENINFLSYTAPDNLNLVGVLPNCGSEVIVDNRLCLSIAFRENLSTGESLRTLEVKILYPSNAKIIKGSDNFYSDGSEIYTDSSIFYDPSFEYDYLNDFLIDIESQDQTPTIEENPSNQEINVNIYIIILLIFLITLLLLLTLLILASKKSLKKIYY